MKTMSEYLVQAKKIYPHSHKMQLQWVLQKYDLDYRKIIPYNFNFLKKHQQKKIKQNWRSIKDE